MGQKNFLGKKKFGLIKFWVKNIFGSEKFLGQKLIFWSKMILGKNNFWVKNIRGSKKKFGQKDLGPKKFCG